ncbi:unnamed protein product [Protopolystoma xenopodis]|uniref:Uncharacterized protein n=1 Tax=Protopolystoma xenopodis TaxID=117903 RepID=A0A448WEE1_9PLAT|nr:unnamed protein product [Protopolystoma xenopodis]
MKPYSLTCSLALFFQRCFCISSSLGVHSYAYRVEQFWPEFCSFGLLFPWFPTGYIVNIVLIVTNLSCNHELLVVCRFLCQSYMRCRRDFFTCFQTGQFICGYFVLKAVPFTIGFGLSIGGEVSIPLFGSTPRCFAARCGVQE